MFCYENKIIYPLYISSKTFSDSTDLLLIIHENKSYHLYIKDFNRLMFNKTKNTNKKYFCRCCLQCFSSEKVLTEHEENCLVINDKQNVKLGKDSISFKNYSKQFMLILSVFYVQLCQKRVVTKTILTLKNIKIMFLAVLVIKSFVLIINLVKVLFFIEEKMLLTNLLKQLLKSMIIAKK